MVTKKMGKKQKKWTFVKINKNNYVNKRNPHSKVDVFNSLNVDNVDKLFRK